MLLSISGNYENGHISFDEALPTNKKGKVILTFVEDIVENSPKNGIRLGGLEGKVKLPDDFNEPLDDLNEYMYK